MEFAPNTYMLEYQDGAYLCNDTKRVEAPLNLDTLEEAVRQCLKLKQILLDDAPFDDQCFPILARLPKLNMLSEEVPDDLKRFYKEVGFGFLWFGFKQKKGIYRNSDGYGNGGAEQL